MDVSDIFKFFLLGDGEGPLESEAPRGGGASIFIENPRRGVSGRERGRGAGRVSAANWGIGGRGAKYFFSGPKCPPRRSNVQFSTVFYSKK